MQCLRIRVEKHGKMYSHPVENQDSLSAKMGVSAHPSAIEAGVGHETPPEAPSCGIRHDTQVGIIG
jgi:hypothetical protein